jgi:hypothetical protein
MDATRNLIDYAMDSNGVEFRNELYASIHDRVTAAIEAKKQELAGNLVRQEEKEEGAGHEKAEKKMMKSLDKNADGKHTKADHQMESVEPLDEGKMEKMTLSGLWHKHGNESYHADQGYGIGAGSMKNSSHAATAIENHVRKHYGNKVADDMVSHSDHSVAHAEYAGPGESEHHEKEAEKLRKKHGIGGSLHGESYVKESSHEEKDEKSEKEEPKKPNAFTMKSKSPSEFAKSSSGGKTKETKTGRTHSSGDRY